MPKLTKRLIDATTPRSTGEVVLWDDQLPGFGLRVHPSGKKVFFVRYRTPRQRRRLTLGPYGVLTVDDARQMAQQTLLAVHQGRDPAGQTKALRQAPTVADLATRYLTEHAAVHKRASSLRKDKEALRWHILPALGPLPVPLVVEADIRRLHHQLRATPIAANRVLSLLSKMFALAEQWGLRPRHTNSVEGIVRYKETKRQRYLSLEELAALGSVLLEAEATQTVRPAVIACIRLLLLTGARVGEILTLQWSYIDPRGMAWLPDSKTGPKPLYLPPPALAVLRSLPRESVWVLPSTKAGRPLSRPYRPWVQLRTRAGLADVRLHDLRHTFASIGVQSGLSLPIIGGLLGHQHPSTTSRYSHMSDDPLHQAAARIGALVAAALLPKAC